MILDTILVTQDPADAAVTEGGTTRLTRTDQQAVQPGPRADDDGNLVLNPSFEVGTTQGWHAAYQSQWALTEEHYDEDRPFDGERCLHLDLMRNRRAPLVQVWQVCGGLASAPFRVAEGERYTISCQARSDGPVTAGLGIGGRAERSDVPASPGWRPLTATLEATAARGPSTCPWRPMARAPCGSTPAPSRAPTSPRPTIRRWMSACPPGGPDESGARESRWP